MDLVEQLPEQFVLQDGNVEWRLILVYGIGTHT
jgi:hypothetical protein